MRLKTYLLSASTGLALVLGATCAQAQGAAPLSGSVASAEEGKMEGVLVSAKKDGGTVTTTVTTNEKGEYAFPAGRLDPGHYTITIRAIGYELDGKGEANVAAGQQAKADIKLKKAKNVALQLSSAEWIMSAPGTEAQKKFLEDCVGCHTVQRIFRSNHTADEFMQIFKRMSSYSPGSVPTHPQPTVGESQRGFGSQERMEAESKWLETVNLASNTTWEYPLKTLPRPKGKATHVIVTEYDLPRAEAQPHDVIIGPDGMVWYSDFAQQYAGFMDPKTGKATDIQLPLVKKGFPTGNLNLEPDNNGNMWLSGMYQTGVFKIDAKTHQATHYPLPDEWQKDHTQESMVSPNFSHVNGKVWTNNQDTREMYQLDLATGKWSSMGQMKDESGKLANAYGMPVDAKNGLYLLDFGGQSIGHFDAETKKVSVHPTPSPNSRPRRGRIDAEGKLWFAEYGGDAIAMYDPKGNAIKEWRLPTQFSAPYDAVANKDASEAWTGSMLTDQVDRLDVKTGTYTEYLLPHTTNIRRVFVDSSTKPNTLWVGNNHGATIVKVEPLD
jgi:virginiamycin B lyase